MNEVILPIPLFLNLLWNYLESCLSNLTILSEKICMRKFFCVVTKGDPPFTIAWSFHGHNLTSNIDFQIRTSNIGDRTSFDDSPSQL